MEWRDAPGTGGMYQVSEYGDVRRNVPGPGTYVGRVLKPKYDRKGYVYYHLGLGDQRVRVKAHRLVLEAFTRPPTPGEFALHGDDQPRNNHISNLRWGTPAENMADRKRNSGWYLGPTHNREKTHCRNGHEYTPENTYRKFDKRHNCIKRVCRTCHRVNRRRADEKRLRDQGLRTP